MINQISVNNKMIKMLSDQKPNLREWFDKDIFECYNSYVLTFLFSFYIDDFEFWWDETKLKPAEFRILEYNEDLLHTDPDNNWCIDQLAYYKLIHSKHFVKCLPFVNQYLDGLLFQELFLNQYETIHIWKHLYVQWTEFYHYHFLTKTITDMVEHREFKHWVLIGIRENLHYINVDLLILLKSLDGLFWKVTSLIKSFSGHSQPLYLEWVSKQKQEDKLRLMNLFT